MVRYFSLILIRLILLFPPFISAQENSLGVVVESQGMFCLYSVKNKLCGGGRSIPNVIDNPEDFALLNDDCDAQCTVPDFSQKLVLDIGYGGDCLMKLQPIVFWNAATEVMTVKTYNIWGGCRAGGFKSIQLLVDRPTTENIDVKFIEVQVDSQEEADKLKALDN